MPTPTVSELLISAGNRLRVDFQAARESSFHAAQTGGEVEEILRKFLNEHLPQRFQAASAFCIDSENTASKQTDVAIYDALNSPVLRSTPVQQILPVDHVAAVIEVKSSLNKAELTDAYAKIASVKALKKKPLSQMDVAATGSTLRAVGTLGIVFAFDSTTSLDALAENAKELNNQYDSSVCPDLICVLDKGSITYLQQFAQNKDQIGMMMMADANFVIPPAYVMLSILRDGESTLNRLMMVLLSQLTFFAHRPSTLPFAQLLDKANKEATIIESYMFDTERKRHVAPEEHRKPTPAAAQFRIVQEGKDIGQLAYFKWQDGGYVLGRGAPPASLILSAALPNEINMQVFTVGDALYSSIVKLTEAEFRQWSDNLPKIPAFSKLAFVPINE